MNLENESTDSVGHMDSNSHQLQKRFLCSTSTTWNDLTAPVLNIVKFEGGILVAYEMAEKGRVVTYHNSSDRVPAAFWNINQGMVDLVLATNTVARHKCTISAKTWGAAIFLRCIQQSEQFPCFGREYSLKERNGCASYYVKNAVYSEQITDLQQACDAVNEVYASCPGVDKYYKRNADEVLGWLRDNADQWRLCLGVHTAGIVAQMEGDILYWYEEKEEAMVETLELDWYDEQTCELCKDM